ncbi:LysR family transcriptional regulator [Salimicrobium jeotgali]|uniref:Transcriptional regulator n=1 Tax=Salimicrobium jeotgali TaxID=1230341 RepID=K2H7E4_9BACI|nr:LysR family transcriptional regulator [Salimicrobium jeotgali]AKG04914.1 LysR family transcriptional regulator [Salimicrobium jeotgali]EKE31585.1 transcriptional regulator [Salimicrobium jeotgali]MBM7696406.1 DNA-binding transcriptional LysR family regulator [Salimicrobium jeotgali]
MDSQLEVFVTVAELENFSRAAERLHMTQPAVSQYIKVLEKSMDARLFDRSNKYVRLTQAGEIVYHHAKEIIGLYTSMHALIDDLTNKASGTISIGASYTYGEYVLPEVLKRLKEEAPEITPSVTIGNTKEICKLISDYRLDIGIVEGEVKDENITVEPFETDELYVVSSPDSLTSREGNFSPEELEEETWIVREEGSGTRRISEKFFSSAGILPVSRLEFGSTQLIKEAVEAGLGIALLSRWTFKKEVIAGDLAIVNVEGLPVQREFSLISRSLFRSKALEIFVEKVKRGGK